MKNSQHGGTLIGIIMGLLVGLGVALAVAIYVTRVPVPFVNKVQPPANTKPGEEAERNKNWDPNSPLYGKTPASNAPAQVAVPASAAAPATAPSAPASSVLAAKTPDAKPGKDTQKDPTELKDSTEAKPPKPAASAKEPADPLAAAIAKATAKPEPGAQSGQITPPKTGDAWTYFLQVGAFREQDQAEATRAKLAMLGLEARTTEREQNGRPMFRVRLGPYNTLNDLQRVKDKVEGQGMEGATVTVPREVGGSN
jgi:cell division protein FtsN